jgi:hypothetical protein
VQGFERRGLRKQDKRIGGLSKIVGGCDGAGHRKGRWSH